MTAAFFDTDAYTNRLIAGGMSPAAAAFEAEIMLHVMERTHRVEAVSVLLATKNQRLREKLELNRDVSSTIRPSRRLKTTSSRSLRSSSRRIKETCGKTPLIRKSLATKTSSS